MPHQYTQEIDPNVCIGNTLSTFNANFLELDEQMQSRPVTVPPQLAAAWGVYNVSGDSFYADGYYNIDTDLCSAISTGQYKIVFDNNMANTYYSVVVTPELLDAPSSGAYALAAAVFNKTLSSFDIAFTVPSTGFYDPDLVQFAVFSY